MWGGGGWGVSGGGVGSESVDSVHSELHQLLLCM